MSYNSDKSYIRDIFDDVSLSLINFLESHEGVTNVQFFEIGGCSKQDFFKWEKLPEDLKFFLLISDGLLLRWNISLNNQNVPLGYLHLNSLEAITESPIKDPRKNKVAFALDSSPLGNVVMIFDKKKDGNPKVYFQDLACRYHFLCDTFSEYYRLMILHMGIPNWQYAFTDMGLDKITRNWLNFFCPDRIKPKEEVEEIKKTDSTVKTNSAPLYKKKFKKLDEYIKKQSELKKIIKEKEKRKMEMLARRKYFK